MEDLSTTKFTPSNEDIQNVDKLFESVLSCSIEHKKGLLPDKWDILAALFLTATATVGTLGLAYGVSCVVASLTGGSVIATVLAGVGISLPSNIIVKSVISKIETLIVTKMAWLVEQQVQNAITIENGVTVKNGIKYLHSKTKTFLIKHFGSPEEFQAFLVRDSLSLLTI